MWRFIFATPQYSIRDASVTVQSVVGNKSVSTDGLFALENHQSRVYNYYFDVIERSDFNMMSYLDTIGKPDFVVIRRSDSDSENRLEKSGMYKNIKSFEINPRFNQNSFYDIYKKS
jgi:hypothetical protein